MIEEVEMYKTSDGKLHPSLEKAQEYDVDRIHVILDNKTKHLLGNLTRADQTKFILALVDSYADAVRLWRELDKIVAQ